MADLDAVLQRAAEQPADKLAARHRWPAHGRSHHLPIHRVTDSRRRVARRFACAWCTGVRIKRLVVVLLLVRWYVRAYVHVHFHLHAGAGARVCT